MKPSERDKDYYRVLGVDEAASKVDIDRQYRREAAKHHPDLGGSEEMMKLLNEAYGVLKDPSSRRDYDRSRRQEAPSLRYVPVTQPTAPDVGAFGYFLSSLLCLLAGFFLLMLVRFQWIWFLWPLAILAVLVLGFGVMMARAAMRAVNNSLPITNRLKDHTNLQEIAFWSLIFTGAYGIYLIIE